MKHPKKKLFQKTQNFQFLKFLVFNFFLNLDLKLASRNTYETCAKSTQQIFFKKGGLRGSKNKNVFTKISQMKLASKNTYETCATSPQTKKKTKKF